MGVCFRLDVLELIHKLLINVQTACRIKYHHVIAVFRGVLYRLPCNDHRVYLTHFKDLYPCLFAYYLQLIDSRRTVHVTGSKQWTLPLILEVLRQLCSMGGLTGALETHHHYDAGGTVGEFYP